MIIQTSSEHECGEVENASQPALRATDEIISPQELAEEIAEKINRVQKFMHARNLHGVLLIEVRNFSWITAGLGSNRIVITSERGAASFLIMRDGAKYLIASNSEAARLMDENLRGLDFELREFQWHEQEKQRDIVEEISAGQRIGTDTPVEDLTIIDLTPLRYQLAETEIKKYRWLGRHTIESVESVCRRVQPGMSEREIEAMISDELMRRGIRPTVLLIGADDRIFNYRHATPSDKRLDRYCMVNVCAERWGLVAAATRFVHFGSPPAELDDKFRAAAFVNAQFQAHSKPGARASEIFEKAKKWYAESGYEGEWSRHHQGGAIGYNEREWIALPRSPEVIHERQAFAWNPTVQGAKVEDTIIAYKDSIENITEGSNEWRMIETEVGDRTIASPGVLIR
jgi:Xaa-Pro dipeptidase